MFLSCIDLWNSASIMLQAGSDKANQKDIEFFLSLIYKKTKDIQQSTSKVLSQLERAGLEDKSKIFSEFVERISRINSKACKSFLVTFFKTVKQICGFAIYKLLFNDVGHLYRDNFSFQSILLMNCIILSEYPSTLEEFVKSEPLFINSLVTLI